MATAVPESTYPRGDAAITYAKKDNIVLPGADPSDSALAATNANAATRETERGTSSSAKSPKLQVVGTGGVNHAPDSADYFTVGSERG